MKITMNIKITSLGLAGLLLATACSNDETQLIECGNEISFNTHVSRATETTTANLKNFKVWANATGFSSQRFIDGLIASKPDGKTILHLKTLFSGLRMWRRLMCLPCLLHR